jgi:hypothetical protein
MIQTCSKRTPAVRRLATIGGTARGTGSTIRIAITIAITKGGDIRPPGQRL